jgi:hypothetical protein
MNVMPPWNPIAMNVMTQRWPNGDGDQRPVSLLGGTARLVVGRILELLLEEASMALGIGQNPVPAGFGQRSKAS